MRLAASVVGSSPCRAWSVYQRRKCWSVWAPRCSLTRWRYQSACQGMASRSHSEAEPDGAVGLFGRPLEGGVDAAAILRRERIGAQAQACGFRGCDCGCDRRLELDPVLGEIFGMIVAEIARLGPEIGEIGRIGR